MIAWLKPKQLINLVRLYNRT